MTPQELTEAKIAAKAALAESVTTLTKAEAGLV